MEEKTIKTNNMKKEEPTSADETQPIVTEGTIKYKLSIYKECYEFGNEASIMADLTGLMIAKRVHEDMANEIVKLKELGIQPKFKAAFNQRHKEF